MKRMSNGIPDTAASRDDPSRRDFLHLAAAGSLAVAGMAGLSLVGVAAAVANAVHHATGKRIRDLPIKPEKLVMP
jgi:hypothetical protein